MQVPCLTLLLHATDSVRPSYCTCIGREFTHTRAMYGCTHACTKCTKASTSTYGQQRGSSPLMSNIFVYCSTHTATRRASQCPMHFASLYTTGTMWYLSVSARARHAARSIDMHAMLWQSAGRLMCYHHHHHHHHHSAPCIHNRVALMRKESYTAPHGALSPSRLGMPWPITLWWHACNQHRP